MDPSPNQNDAQKSPYEVFLENKKEFIANIKTLLSYGLLPVFTQNKHKEVVALPTKLSDIDVLQNEFGLGEPDTVNVKTEHGHIESPAFLLPLPAYTEEGAYALTAHDANLLAQSRTHVAQGRDAPINALLEEEESIDAQTYMVMTKTIEDVIHRHLVIKQYRESIPLQGQSYARMNVQMPIEAEVIGCDGDYIHYMVEEALNKEPYMQNQNFVLQKVGMTGSVIPQATPVLDKKRFTIQDTEYLLIQTEDIAPAEKTYSGFATNLVPGAKVVDDNTLAKGQPAQPDEPSRQQQQTQDDEPEPNGSNETSSSSNSLKNTLRRNTIT